MEKSFRQGYGERVGYGIMVFVRHIEKQMKHGNRRLKLYRRIHYSKQNHHKNTIYKEESFGHYEMCISNLFHIFHNFYGVSLPGLTP